MKTTFYVQIEPDIHPSGRIRRLRAVNVTQNRPEFARNGVMGTALVKLTLDIDEAIFQPLVIELGEIGHDSAEIIRGRVDEPEPVAAS